MNWTVLGSVGLGGVLAVSLVSWIMREMTAARKASQKLADSQQLIITNHIHHNTEALVRLTGAMDKLTTMLDRKLT